MQAQSYLNNLLNCAWLFVKYPANKSKEKRQKSELFKYMNVTTAIAIKLEWNQWNIPITQHVMSVCVYVFVYIIR